MGMARCTLGVAMSLYLGIDIGTSSLKAVMVTGDGQCLAEATASYRVATPAPNHREQDPELWWQALLQACTTLRTMTTADWKSVQGLGLSGQMHGVVLLDEDKKPLHPAILWNDGRATDECTRLTDLIPEIGEITGVPPMPGFAAPKLLWLKNQARFDLARAHKLLAPKDYIRARLTGVYATDMCDASGLQLLDVRHRKWSIDIVETCGLRLDQMPDVVEGHETTGHISQEAAQLLQLSEGLPVVAGAGDAAAAAIGIGAIDEGDAFLSLGTSAQYFVTTESYRPRPERLIHAFAHGLPRRWFQMAALLNGASVAGWAARALGSNDDEGQLLADLTEQASSAYAGPTDLLFLPYLTGERTPLNDPNARGVFCGLTPETTKAEMFAAVLEGVAFSLADAQECLAQAGTQAPRLLAVGGGTQNAFWMQMISSALNRPIDLVQSADRGPAFGAARLAQLGHEKGRPADICTKPAVVCTFEPNTAVADRFAERLGGFRALYQALKAGFATGFKQYA